MSFVYQGMFLLVLVGFPAIALSTDPISNHVNWRKAIATAVILAFIAVLLTSVPLTIEV